MVKTSLKVLKREILGSKVKKLRREGILPANIYGKKIKSQAIKVKLSDFQDVYKKAGETGIIYLSVDNSKKERPVLIHNIQIDPVEETYLHVDFHQVDLTEKATVSVPVEIKGEAPAEKKGLVLLTLLDEIEVEALPSDLPDKFEIDVSKLEEVDQGISIKDLKFNRNKVKPLVEDEGELIVKVTESTPEEVEEEVAPEPGEVPTTEQKVEEEAEGEKQEEGKGPGKETKQPKVEAKQPAKDQKQEQKPKS